MAANPPPPRRPFARPIKYEEYDDVIRFTTKAGEFNTTIRAKVAALAVTCTDLVQFGNCPTNEVSRSPPPLARATAGGSMLVGDGGEGGGCGAA